MGWLYWHQTMQAVWYWDETWVKDSRARLHLSGLVAPCSVNLSCHSAMHFPTVGWYKSDAVPLSNYSRMEQICALCVKGQSGGHVDNRQLWIHLGSWRWVYTTAIVHCGIWSQPMWNSQTAAGLLLRNYVHATNWWVVCVCLCVWLHYLDRNGLWCVYEVPVQLFGCASIFGDLYGLWAIKPKLIGKRLWRNCIYLYLVFCLF